MGIGPAPAIRKALKFANKELSDMSLVEVRVNTFFRQPFSERIYIFLFVLLI